jgi:hypothetical protein
LRISKFCFTFVIWVASSYKNSVWAIIEGTLENHTQEKNYLSKMVLFLVKTIA